VECVQADLAERDKVVAACEGCDVVFHVGARAGYWGDYSGFFSTNVEGTRNVLAGCQQHGIFRLVYTSSPSVVFSGRDIQGVDESVPYAEHFESHYPATKRIAEEEALAASGQNGLMVCALRPHLIWGPRDNHIIPRILQRARAGKLAIIGDGLNKVDVVYVENAARAHLQAADALEPGSSLDGRAYFLSQGEPVVLWNFINRILEGFGIPSLTRHVPVGVASLLGHGMELMYRGLGLSGEPRMTRFLARELSCDHWFDISAARRDFCYDPEKIPTEEGLRRLFEAGEPE
jgi:nucleoside-diphosphate-sugar epimerase